MLHQWLMNPIPRSNRSNSTASSHGVLRWMDGTVWEKMDYKVAAAWECRNGSKVTTQNEESAWDIHGVNGWVTKIIIFGYAFGWRSPIVDG